MTTFVRQHWLALVLGVIAFLLIFGPAIAVIGGSVTSSGVH